MYGVSVVFVGDERSLVCCAVLCVLSSFAIISLGKKELIALLLLSFGELVAVIVICLSLTVQWVSLQCVIVAFSGHTYLLVPMHFYKNNLNTFFFDYY